MAKSKSTNVNKTDVYSVRVDAKVLKKAEKKLGSKGLNKKIKNVINNVGGK
jgi:hypothetical protein